jgi:hypothetical protein
MDKTLVVVSVLLIIGILVFVVLGSLGATDAYERFEDTKAPSPAKPATGAAAVSSSGSHGDDLTTNERELFEDLKQNKLTNDDVKRLIEEGVLTELLINKFLKKLDFPGLTMPTVAADKADSKAHHTKEAAKTTTKDKADKAAKRDTVEAFSCESTFVGVPKAWDETPRWWDGSPAKNDHEDTMAVDEVNNGEEVPKRGRCGKYRVKAYGAT